MNWTSNKPFPTNGCIREEYDLCDHVHESHDKAYWTYCEDDSFGPVLRKVVCKECKEEYDEARKLQTDFCSDCSGEFPLPQLKPFKDYYFDALAGEEPLLICDSCRKLPAHIARQELYQKQRDEDLEVEGDDEDDIDWDFEDEDVDWEESEPEDDSN